MFNFTDFKNVSFQVVSVFYFVPSVSKWDKLKLKLKRCFIHERIHLTKI